MFNTINKVAHCVGSIVETSTGVLNKSMLALDEQSRKLQLISKADLVEKFNELEPFINKYKDVDEKLKAFGIS